jgi:seryl-tRNA(Sec) selenium transferase
VHLQNGATLVAYSGGKCIRGPQTAGLLLGRKDLVRAALGSQRAASWLLARHEGRQGRGHGDAHGR